MPQPLQLLFPPFSHDQHHETDAAKRKGGLFYFRRQGRVWMICLR